MREALIMYASTGLLIFAMVLLTPSAARNITMPDSRVLILFLIATWAALWPLWVYRAMRSR